MNPLRVLIVDDDAGDRVLLSRVLADGPHAVEVEAASNIAEFRKAIATRAFDCVLIDYNLSFDTTAEDVVAELRGMCPTCPGIVLSNSDAQDIVVRSFQSGGTDFLNKSVVNNPDLLWSRIDAALRNNKRMLIERRVAQRRIKKLIDLSETDPLTGLANRRAIERVIRPARRVTFDRRGWVSILMIDIDHFKRVNDEHGHEFGDEVLRGIGKVLADSDIPHAHAVRWGGEEFLLFAPDTTAIEARLKADLIRESISRLRFSKCSRQLKVTASIGVSTVRSAALSMETVHQADQALYLAKRSGRDRVCTFEMVLFDRYAREATAPDPEGRLKEVLSVARDRLGPVQQEHLTAHSEKVSKLAVEIAMKMGANDRDIKRVRLAGLCHDIGKFAIPDDLLNKVGMLTVAEKHCLKRHTDDSALLAESLGVDKATTDCIRRHDHWFNTPEVMQKTQHSDRLPTDQIVGVADAIAAMVGGRAYKPRMTAEAAKEELKRSRGQQFDPAVVDAALCVI